jgi:glucosamine 6-phosphate synthetase-like amidotransferase/phosphosugar isomerase protein
MCQLAAYIGDRPIAPLLLRAIENQEPLLGAHATGMGVVDESVLRIEKDFGHVRRVRSTTAISTLKGSIGIAHTRYSSNARDDFRYNTREMAHPFVDDTGKLALMHNGVLFNYRKHWENLQENHVFRSYSAEVDDITDSEVAVHMLSDALAKGVSMEEGLRSIASQFTGFFLFGVIHAEHPEEVWIANWHQPCLVAMGDGEAMFCSSPIGFHDVRDEFDRVFAPPKNSIIKLTKHGVEISPLDCNRKIPPISLNSGILTSSIFDILRKTPSIDVVKLLTALMPEAFARAYGVSIERFKELVKQGFRPINPYFGVLDMLISDGVVIERINFRSEGGIPDTPRFTYSLA